MLFNNLNDRNWHFEDYSFVFLSGNLDLYIEKSTPKTIRPQSFRSPKPNKKSINTFGNGAVPF